MPREKGLWSAGTYETTAREIHRDGGSATHLGEQRARQGLGLDPLVDPKTRGSTRASQNLLVLQPDKTWLKTWLLECGPAMPVDTNTDTTGSMGGNVDIAFRVQPQVQNLLVQGEGAVLGRYHVQMATGVIQDRLDQFPYQHSEFEPDNEVEAQMRLLVPERSGGDSTEDYQFGLWYVGTRVQTDIRRYGLKGYYFVVGDEQGRDRLNPQDISDLFGVRDVQECSIRELGQLVLQNWHTFFLQIEDTPYVTSYWSQALGPERVVLMPRTEQLAVVQALIIGLTEGTLDLQSGLDFLGNSRINRTEAKQVIKAVSHIPLRAQADLPGFDKIPLKGALFGSREDLWPIGYTDSSPNNPPSPSSQKEEISWQL